MVGKGAFGTVYKALWRNIHVAVKYIEQESERNAFTIEVIENVQSVRGIVHQMFTYHAILIHSRFDSCHVWPIRTSLLYMGPVQNGPMYAWSWNMRKAARYTTSYIAARNPIIRQRMLWAGHANAPKELPICTQCGRSHWFIVIWSRPICCWLTTGAYWRYAILAQSLTKPHWWRIIRAAQLGWHQVFLRY